MLEKIPQICSFRLMLSIACAYATSVAILSVIFSMNADPIPDDDKSHKVRTYLRYGCAAYLFLVNMVAFVPIFYETQRSKYMLILLGLIGVPFAIYNAYNLESSSEIGKYLRNNSTKLDNFRPQGCCYVDNEQNKSNSIEQCCPSKPCNYTNIYNQTCIELIDNMTSKIGLTFALAASAFMIIVTITGIDSLKRVHYQEASQSVD